MINFVLLYPYGKIQSVILFLTSVYMTATKKEFYVFIERDEDGYYVGEVPQLKACYSQGETIDELMKNIKEVIELCLVVCQDWFDG